MTILDPPASTAGSAPWRGGQGPGLLLASEFASVRVSIDRRGRGPRLRVSDLQASIDAYFDPLEVASLCWWPLARREELLQVGPYDLSAPRPQDGEWEL